MAAKLPPERELIAALNSLVHFQTEYWNYVEPRRAVKLWAHFRDRVEEIMGAITDPLEFAKATERVRQTDEFLVSKAWSVLRMEDFALLDRKEISKDKWWYWLDEVKAGRLTPKVGPQTKAPTPAAAAPSPAPAS